MKKNLEQRAHSKFSASASERWLNCPASVEFCEDIPPLPTSHAAEYGTKAHDWLEKWLLILKKKEQLKYAPKGILQDRVIYDAVKKAVIFVNKNWDREKEDLFTERRFYLTPIHEEMFGTGDITIVPMVGSDGTLKVYDYKNGSGHVVEIETVGIAGIRFLNTQLMFYLIGAVYEFGWDSFRDGEIGIIQPNAIHKKGSYRKAKVSKKEIKKYIEFFKRGVERTQKPNPKFMAGNWCFFCPGKFTCPAKKGERVERNKEFFESDI